MANATHNSERREPVLSLRNISKHFGAVQALTDIELDIYPARSLRLSATMAPASRRWSRSWLACTSRAPAR